MFEDITNMVDKEKSVDVNTQFGFWDTFGNLTHDFPLVTLRIMWWSVGEVPGISKMLLSKTHLLAHLFCANKCKGPAKSLFYVHLQLFRLEKIVIC